VRWVDILVRPSQALGTARRNDRRRRWFGILYLRRQVEHDIDRNLSSDLSQELGTAHAGAGSVLFITFAGNLRY
jgi:hypothetical protein